MATDEDILDLIFNPGMDGVAQLQGPSGAPAPSSVSSASNIDSKLLSEIRALEALAIRAAETKDLATARKLLDECIQKCPTYASAYNNRAQVKQLAIAAAASSSSSSDSAAPSSDSSNTEARKQSLNDALADVEAAIKYGEGDNQLLRQSYTQRALIRRALGGEDNEAAALNDYQKAAGFGGEFAKREAVRLNPYSALCNQYLQQALENHWSGLGKSGLKETSESGCASATSSCSSDTTAEKSHQKS